MKKHRDSIHDDLKLKCDRCSFVTGRQETLKKHKDRQHEGKQFHCKECKFTGSQTGVYQHWRSLHLGIRYQCTFCSYKATKKDHLRVHILKKHENNERN